MMTTRRTAEATAARAVRVGRTSKAMWRAIERAIGSSSAAAHALQRRWEELPEHVCTDAQLIGRRSMGCEGTHGVFPKCDFACKPCYHSTDANRVRVDGPHTIAQIRRQMAFLREQRGPTSFAQLIGGEVSLLAPLDHVAALEEMWSAGRVPMSFSHGDFDDEYLRAVTVRPDGTARFPSTSWAVHIDSTMRGRTGAKKPASESELNPFRAEVCARFARLRRDHGVRSYVAHNMTVTPANLDGVADVVATCGRMGFRMFSFQPAAYVGDDRRWDDGYRTISDDDVWAAIERGVGRHLPFRAMQFGDLRCNRVCWGAFVGDRYVPALEEDDPADAEARDVFYNANLGPFVQVPRVLIAARVVCAAIARPRSLVIGARWLGRFVRRAGGLPKLLGGVRPVTFVMHSFIDAELVAPAWEMLQRGVRSDDAEIAAAQERLEACVYTMGHPETGQLVPACVQHSVLDPAENETLVELLPLRRA